MADALRRAAGSSIWVPAAATMTAGSLTGLRQHVRMRGLRVANGQPQVLMVIRKDAPNAFKEHTDLISKLNAQLAEQTRLRSDLQKSVDKERYLHGELIHRVKNNLALLSSLIRHQSRTEDSDAARRALDSIGLRVRSIALVHQLLDKNQSLEVLNAGELIKELCELMNDSVLPEKVTLDADVAALDLHNEDATSLCLLINELMTNAIKHAFKGRDSGRIELRFAKNGVEKMELRIRDDGGGIVESETSETARGMTIINALASNLNGELKQHSGNGTEWTLIFHPREFGQLAAE
ncbi:sensor histidine kinase [Palleronia sp. THAF1]|uniref:sensor histidine kinase n=1 Tax=Palleronia sp. THAF1 TaxID=2587842 RepID=UPI0015626C57|nr:sensor histidine kinase [Palleronia sp. THAF1]